MLISNPAMICRMYNIVSMVTYVSGITELVGSCSLTNRLVIRYISTDMQVFEYNEARETWVDFADGVCRDHFNHFADICLPKYENNVVQYRKPTIDACN